MKRLLLKSCLLAMLAGTWTASVWADKKFEIEFKNLYYKPESKDPKEKSLAEAIDKVSTEIELDNTVIKNACNVCHVKGKAKKMRNEYGQKLAELLDRKSDKDNPKKIQESIKKVGALKSSKGPTYDELLKAGKLPAG
jgi:hypothetical protein